MGMKARPGKKFEERATRAVAQLRPELDVQHDQKLLMGYGSRRQFDVVGREQGRVVRTYEAREHGRPLEIKELEAWVTKVDKLQDPPEVAGMISAHGFTSGPIDWVRHYGDTERVHELIHLRPSVPEDWQGNIRQLQLASEISTIRPRDLKLVFQKSASAPTEREISVLTRRTAFLYADDGTVCGNVLDELNREMQIASSTGNMDVRSIRFPVGSSIQLGHQRAMVIGVEVAFEIASVETGALVDFSGRFPDAAVDVLTQRTELIEDRDRRVHLTRTGRHIAVGFSDEPSIDFDALPQPGLGSGTDEELAEQGAQLQLQVALALLAGPKSDEAPNEPLASMLMSAQQAFVAGDHNNAELLYKETLGHGTALAALCNLAFIAIQRRDDKAAASYSWRAIELFPLQPHGYVNLSAALRALGRHSEARTLIDSSRWLHGLSPALRREEALLLYHEQKFAEAAEFFYNVVLHDSADAVSLANLARCEAQLGLAAEAAFDARRASDIHPDDPALAEVAIRCCGASGEWAVVTSILARLETLGRVPTHEGLRIGAVAAISRAGYLDARRLLLLIPDSERTARDYATIGRLGRTLDPSDGDALVQLRHAVSIDASSTEARVWLAEALVEMGETDEPLQLLEGLDDADAVLLHARVVAVRGNPARLLEVVEKRRDVDAQRAVFAAIDSLVRAGDLGSIPGLAAWLANTPSDDPAIKCRQLPFLAIELCTTPNAERRAVAVKLLDDCRQVDPNGIWISEVLLELSAGDHHKAMALAADGPLSDRDPDHLALLAHLSVQLRALDLAGLAGRACFAAARAGRAPRVSSLSEVVAATLLCGFARGDDLDELRAIASEAPLPASWRGRLVTATLAYLEHDYDRCVGLLEPMIKGATVSGEGVLLMAQCLAELGSYTRLRETCTEFLHGQLALVEWLITRQPKVLLPREMLPAVAAATFRRPREFAAVSSAGKVMQAASGEDWASAARGLRAQTTFPILEVTVVRFGHPKEFLRKLFTPR